MNFMLTMLFRTEQKEQYQKFLNKEFKTMLK